MKKEQKNQPNYFILTILIFVVVAFAVSYFRYVENLNYDIYVYTECDPIQEICTTDEESFYTKFIAPAAVLDEWCGLQAEECIFSLYEQGLAEKLNCDEYLEEWEYCTSPEEFEESEEEFTLDENLENTEESKIISDAEEVSKDDGE